MIIVLLMESEILKMKLMKSLNLKDKFLKLPIIQGGMGIGVSRCRLAGAVAKEGGMGVLSTAQIGYDDPDFTKHPEETNLRVLPEQIRKAKEIADGNGMVAVNIMAVTQLYETYVKTACAAGVDAIISGAGLPTELPKFAEGYDVALAPIVSSTKSANVILKFWDKSTTAPPTFWSLKDHWPADISVFPENSWRIFRDLIMTPRSEISLH